MDKEVKLENVVESGGTASQGFSSLEGSSRAQQSVTHMTWERRTIVNVYIGVPAAQLYEVELFFPMYIVEVGEGLEKLKID